MWLILVDRSISTLGTVKDELSRRLSMSDTVAFFGAADEITHAFADGPTEGPSDVAAALRWAAGTLAGETRVLLVSDLRASQYDDALESAARHLQARCPVDVLLLNPAGYAYWVAERIASGRMVTASSALELGKAMAALLSPPAPAVAWDASAAPGAAAPQRPMPTSMPPYGPPMGGPPPSRASGFGVVGAAAGAVGAVGSAIGRLLRRRRRSGKTSGGPVRLGFTAAHPPEVVSGRWYTLLFVLYRLEQRDTVDEVLRAHVPEIGTDPARSFMTASTQIAPGTVLTLVPAIPGVACTPASVDVAWHEDVQETTFTMCAEAGLGGTRVGAVEVYVGPLLLAVVPVALRVLSLDMPTQPRPRGMVSHAQTVDRVFASYSRHDAWVVDACTAAYEALGVEVLIDRVNLRSGEEWRNSLHSLISQSDLFQLYWSEASAASSEVESEWRFASSLTQKGSRFIRPMFWETPMPLPPVELNHLHFSRIALDQLATLPRTPAP